MKHLISLDEAATLAVALAAYHLFGTHGWLFFAAWFFVPDVSFAAYLAGPRYGAWAYNLLHHRAFAATLGAVSLAAGTTYLVDVAIVFFAHTAFDRMLGYGLKHEDAFGHTHLGTLWRGAASPK